MRRLPHKHQVRDPRNLAFTLIELLVSMSILVLLLVMVMQIVNNTSIVLGNGNCQIDADSQARLLFDRMSHDFGRIVKRSDVDYHFHKESGNDDLAFYSEATGYYPDGVTGSTPKSGVSVVGYRVNNNFQLERLGKSLIWSGVTGATPGVGSIAATDIAMGFYPKTLVGLWPKIADGTDPDYQVIADQVYRLEFNFLLKPFTNASGVAQPAILSDVPWDTRQKNHDSTNGLSDVSAIVVAVGILDNASRKIVQPSRYPGMVDALKDSDSNGSDSILQTWNGTNRSYIAASIRSNIPKAAASQIRIYQRYFYLNPTCP